MTQGAILHSGDRILVMKGQTLYWSESGKRLELWQDESLLTMGKIHRKRESKRQMRIRRDRGKYGKLVRH